MKPEDAAALEESAYDGSKALGIGPEARYLLYGYQEKALVARLCGAVSDGGQVMIVALPESLMTEQGPNTLENIVSSLAVEIQDPPPSVKAINGLKLVCTDGRTPAAQCFVHGNVANASQNTGGESEDPTPQVIPARPELLRARRDHFPTIKCHLESVTIGGTTHRAEDAISRSPTWAKPNGADTTSIPQTADLKGLKI
jgi:hypothetical protein